MKEKIIASRYAEAFLGYSKRTIGFEKAVEEIKTLGDVLLNNPDLKELKNFLFANSITYNEKCDFIDTVMHDSFSEQTRNFIKFLLKKGRIGCIGEIIDYIITRYSHGKATGAILKTAFPLDKKYVQKIREILEKKFQKELSFDVVLDPKLLGGVQIMIGNLIIDGSVKRNLSDLRQQLILAEV